MKTRFALLMPLAVLLLLTSAAFAQWPDDPAENLLVAGGPGEQATPKVGATSDGGAWVLYYDHASGNYDVYVQLLDPDGVPQFDGGLLVSDHPMTTFITEWDFLVDTDDHAIVVTNDIRDGGDWDIFAYRVSPAGEFVWGADGIQLSDNAIDDVGQEITQLDGDRILISWQSGTAVAMRRLWYDGTDPWGANVLVDSQYGNSIPRAVGTPDGGFFLQYVQAQGSQIWAPRHLYLQRFDAGGAPQWPGDGVAINDAGGIGFQMRPALYPDTQGWVYSVWYDSHLNNQLHTFAQHTNDEGTTMWTDNGVIVSDAAELQMSPTATVNPTNGDLYVFYMSSNTGQTQWGIGAQRFDPEGNRQFGANGLALQPLGDAQFSNLHATTLFNQSGQGYGGVVTYFEDVFGSNDSYVMADAVDFNGDPAWGGEVTLSSVASNKLHLHAAPVPGGTTLAVWADERSDPSRDIFLQNVNADGSLGPWQAQEPVFIEVLNPEPTVIPAGGGSISYDVRVVSTLPNTIPNVQYWTTATLPNGTTTQPLFTATFTLFAGMDYIATAPQQVIPAFAPPGQYSYNVAIGFMNGPQVGDAFGFEKLAPTAADSPGSEVSYDTWGTHGSLELDKAVAGEAVPAATPDRFTLSQAYPNPFNPTASLAVTLPEAGDLHVEVVNLAGQRVATLSQGVYEAGTHQFSVDGTAWASGVYFVRASLPGHATQARKLVLLK